MHDRYLIIAGNPGAGYLLVGPFEDYDTALNGAEEFDGDAWHVSNLLPPPGVKEPKGQHVLVAGDLSNGFKFYGPFPTMDDAATAPGFDWSFVAKMDTPEEHDLESTGDEWDDGSVDSEAE